MDGFSILLFIVGAGAIIFTYQNRQSILDEAKAEATTLVQDASIESETLINNANERVNRLKATDKEITSRLKQSRAIIENITDKSCLYAANIELLTEDDLLSSQSYQEDRKRVKSQLKKLAINAIDGVKGSNADVNITRFVSIAAKADMAGALLLTTVEMLCSKTTANNGHQGLEKTSRVHYRN